MGGERIELPELQAQGECAERFAPLREALETNLRSGAELGASITVVIDGETVVDLWGGHRDAARGAPWERDTIVNVWSTTKAVMNLAALMLADRGELDLDAPVARYWPAFGAAGKRGVLVRHVMSHTSGVSAWRVPVSIEDLYDWEHSTALLADQDPFWEPGTVAGYHSFTQGHLLGELVRRVTGLSLKRFVDLEIAQPLEADFQIGARERDWQRIAEIVPPQQEPEEDAPPSDFDRFPEVRAEVANSADWRRAEIGAANGHGNARSVARNMQALAQDGEAGGVRLLSAATIARIFEVQADGVDLVFHEPLRWGLGYALPQPLTLPHIPEGRICFWGGWGGSMIIMDLERRLTVAYVMNRMLSPAIIGSEVSAPYVTAVYQALRAGGR